MDELNPFDFDQSDKGWRLLDRQGKFLEAAKAIESYIASHKKVIETQTQVSLQTMYFHAGQETQWRARSIMEKHQKTYRNRINHNLAGTYMFREQLHF